MYLGLYNEQSALNVSTLCRVSRSHDLVHLGISLLVHGSFSIAPPFRLMDILLLHLILAHSHSNRPHDHPRRPSREQTPQLKMRWTIHKRVLDLLADSSKSGTSDGTPGAGPPRVYFLDDLVSAKSGGEGASLTQYSSTGVVGAKLTIWRTSPLVNP